MITFNTHKAQTPNPTAARLHKRILITGADNSLARFLAYGLRDAGAEVSAQAVSGESFLKLKADFPTTQYSIADIRFAEALAASSPEIILHASAELTGERISEWPISNFNRTVDKVVALCECVRTNAPQARIVLLSTTDVYGTCPIPMSETSPLAPVSMNGRYSRMAEQVLQDFADYHKIDTTILRVASAYGPGIKHNPVFDLLYNLLGPTGTNMKRAMDLDSTRDVVHAADVLQAVKLILSGNHVGIYNVASGHSLTLRELNTHLCAILELEDTAESGTAMIVEASQQQFDIHKILNLGYAPQVPLIEGLRGFAGWWSGLKAA